MGAIVKLTAANWLFYFYNQFSLRLYVNVAKDSSSMKQEL